MSEPQAPAIKAGDFDLFCRAVKFPVKDGKNAVEVILSVEEMVLHQRDRFAEYLAEALSADDIRPTAEKFLSEGQDVSIEEILKLILAVAQRVGGGWLTGLLAIALDVPENCEDDVLKKGRQPAEGVAPGDRLRAWLLLNVRLRVEVEILKAFFEMNDLAAYLKNVGSLLPLTLQAAKVEEQLDGAPEA